MAEIGARHMAHIEALDEQLVAMCPAHDRRARELRDSYKSAHQMREEIERDEAFIARMEARRRRREEVNE